jgi:ATP phosphoribosyltransferase regulatory subunit
VIHPIPSGTRDVLPDEMRELRAITAALRDVFEEHGYGEIYTPAIEYEGVLRRGGDGVSPAYRVFDDHGDVLALRSDMTVPIARVVATRYATADPPLRFCSFAHVYRQVKPFRGEMREHLQAGVELIGAPGSDGTAEALSVMARALEAAGLRDFRVALGDASLYPSLLASCEVPQDARARLLTELVRRNLVALALEIDRLEIAPEHAQLLLDVPQLRGGPQVLDVPGGPAAEAVAGLRALHARLEPAVAERVIFDLGLARGLGYYTGAVFDVLDPALGVAIGGGGRYDDLLANFGRPLPAVGFALGVDRLHIALTGEEARR